MEAKKKKIFAFLMFGAVVVLILCVAIATIAHFWAETGSFYKELKKAKTPEEKAYWEYRIRLENCQADEASLPGPSPCSLIEPVPMPRSIGGGETR